MYKRQIVKSDVHGSSEAIKSAINQIVHDEVKPKIILSDIGMINETDVSLAKASNAILIGFNVKPNREAKKLAEEQNVEIKFFKVNPTEHIFFILLETDDYSNIEKTIGQCKKTGDFRVTPVMEQTFNPK